MKKKLDTFLFYTLAVPLIFIWMAWEITMERRKPPKIDWWRLVLCILAAHGALQLLDDGWRYFHGP
jgi:hypothetical protein